MAEKVLAQEALFEEEYASSGNTVWSRFFKNPLARVGFIILALIIVVSIFAPLLAPYDHTAVDPLNACQKPSAAHILGTDHYGRDIFSRLLYGARFSIAIGLGAQGLALLVGLIFGTIAGYYGGKVDNLILRICDIVQSIPATLMAIIISQTLGTGFFPTVIALAVGGTTMMIRMLRATILTVREEEFIEAARLIDCSNARIMIKHIIPNSLAPMIVTTSTGIGRMILSSAGLSYLGLGIQEPAAEWGAMLSTAKIYIANYPYMIISPGVAIILLVLSFNLIGDGLRDALDPKLRS